MSLQNKLYKEILQKKKELEELRKNGDSVKAERDLPCMAVGCEYAGTEKCGFSGSRKKVNRPDVIKPFDPLLEQALMAQAPNIPQLPFILFEKKKQPCQDPITGEIKYRKVVDRFIGTCAEDNASNSLLYGLIPIQKPVSLKEITFIHPIRPRTLKRERMCVVCRNIFTEP